MLVSGEMIHLRPSLFPVLLLLSHLFPSTIEGTDSTMSLAAFVPYIIRYVNNYLNLHGHLIVPCLDLQAGISGPKVCIRYNRFLFILANSYILYNLHILFVDQSQIYSQNSNEPAAVVW